VHDLSGVGNVLDESELDALDVPDDRNSHPTSLTNDRRSPLQEMMRS
jgi:hypothetical protein